MQQKSVRLAGMQKGPCSTLVSTILNTRDSCRGITVVVHGSLLAYFQFSGGAHWLGVSVSGTPAMFSHTATAVSRWWSVTSITCRLTGGRPSRRSLMTSVEEF